MTKRKRNPYAVKMDGATLQEWLHFKRRGSKKAPRKGKGSFKRQKGEEK